MRPRLPARVARWLELEQHVNERINNDAVYTSLGDDANEVLPQFRAETGGAWRQEYVLARDSRARVYGPIRARLDAAFGLRPPRGRVPMFVHPQSRALFASVGERRQSEIVVTPTASSRSVVACVAGRAPWVIKAGIDCRIGHRWRGFEEQQVVRAIALSGLLSSVEPSVFAELKLDWFKETCGAAIDVDGASQGKWDGSRTSGWLLRELPACLKKGMSTLVPLFSLVSHVGGQPSRLETMIRASGEPATRFVIEHVIQPFVRAYTHLAFGEGLFAEMHSQNLLFEVGSDGMLTGQVVIRDLTDMFLNVALRVALGRPLPAPAPDLLAKDRPLAIAWVATDSFLMEWTGRTHWAHSCVSGHGMQGSIWVLHRALRRAFPEVSLASFKRAYLDLWRAALLRALGLDAVIQTGLGGIPVDEAVAVFLGSTDWKARGAKACRLPPRKKLHRIGGLADRNDARGHAVETAWGEVFVVGGVPTYFRPAF